MISIYKPVVQIHSSGKHIDLVAYPLIIDTLYYVLDGESSSLADAVLLDA